MLFYDNAPLRDDEREHDRWIAIRRPPQILSLPDFAQAAPLVSLWHDKRGELTEDVEDTLLVSGLLQRVIILRRPPQSSRLITHHFGSRIVFVRPDDIVGRDIQDLPDRDYGALVAEAYDEALTLGAPFVQATRAIIRGWDGKTIGARYDRVLIPWRWRGSDQFVMCISLRRGRLAEMGSARAVLPP
jgi:hypothetical protein